MARNISTAISLLKNAGQQRQIDCDGRRLLTLLTVAAGHLAWLRTFGSHMTIY